MRTGFYVALSKRWWLEKTVLHSTVLASCVVSRGRDTKPTWLIAVLDLIWAQRKVLCWNAVRGSMKY